VHTLTDTGRSYSAAARELDERALLRYIPPVRECGFALLAPGFRLLLTGTLDGLKSWCCRRASVARGAVGVQRVAENDMAVTVQGEVRGRGDKVRGEVGDQNDGKPGGKIRRLVVSTVERVQSSGLPVNFRAGKLIWLIDKRHSH